MTDNSFKDALPDNDEARALNEYPGQWNPEFNPVSGHAEILKWLWKYNHTIRSALSHDPVKEKMREAIQKIAQATVTFNQENREVALACETTEIAIDCVQFIQNEAEYKAATEQLFKEIEASND